jgi:hypothetical protein
MRYAARNALMTIDPSFWKLIDKRAARSYISASRLFPADLARVPMGREMPPHKVSELVTPAI